MKPFVASLFTVDLWARLILPICFSLVIVRTIWLDYRSETSMLELRVRMNALQLQLSDQQREIIENRSAIHLR